MSSNVNVLCPRCDARLRLKNRADQGKHKCPRCGKVFTLRAKDSLSSGTATMKRAVSDRSRQTSRSKTSRTRVFLWVSPVLVIALFAGAYALFDDNDPTDRGTAGVTTTTGQAAAESSVPEPPALSAASDRSGYDAIRQSRRPQLRQVQRSNVETAPANATVSTRSIPPAESPAPLSIQVKDDSQDWHQWRGPKRDGVSAETGLLDRWPNDGPPLEWRVRGLGSGMSSVAVSGNRLFTMGSKEGTCHIICRQISDGSEVWSTPIGGGDPNATPTVDPEAGLVFGLTYYGELGCVDAKSGELVWRKHFERDFGGKMMSSWGYSESPLVDGDRLICTPGANDAVIVALNKNTGRTIWKSRQPADVGNQGADGAGYSSAVISNGAGVKQYVQLTGRGLISVAADDGRTLWVYNRIANNVANVPTPVVDGDYVFCSTGYGTGAALVKLSRQGNGVRAEEVYFLDGRTLQNHHGGMVLIGDHIYMGHGHNNGFPVCVEFATGEIKWGGQLRGPGGGSAAIVYADGHLYFRYEDGTMALIEANPRKYSLKGEFRIASNNGKSWPHPVVCGGRLYLRDQDELLCYNVTAQAEASPTTEREVSRPELDKTFSRPKLQPVAVAATSTRRTADWPRFRGADGSGVSGETGLPLKWSDGTNVVWQTELPGPGASSPITFGEHVYVTCYSGYGISRESPGDISGLRRHLVCIHRDGGIVWKADMPSRATEFEYVDYINQHGYASSTPAADADVVCVFYGTSGVAVYSHNGELIWHKSCGTGVHEFGSASSPVLYRDLLIINAGIESSSLIAFDKSTGREQWRHTVSVDPQKSRSTPCLVEVSGKHELVFDYQLGKLAAVDPNSGGFLWECESVEKYQNPSPVSHNGLVYAIGGSRMSSVAIKSGGRGDVTATHRLWNTPRGSRVSSPVYYEGYLYWVRESEGIVGCFDAETGRTIYEERLRPSPGEIYASPVIADGKLYYVSRKTGTYVLPARPEFQLLAHNVFESDESVFNGSPAVSGGKIYLRSNRFLYCIGAESP